MDFIRKYIGFGWLVIILSFSGYFDYATRDIGYDISLRILLFILMCACGTIAIMIVNWVKPEVIMTTGGFFGLLRAKLFWHIIAPIVSIVFACIIIAPCILKVLLTPSSTEVQHDFTKYCNDEKIAETELKKCEDVKNELKQNLQTAKAKVESLTKNKETECSEKRLQMYGQVGCDTAIEAFNENEKNITELSVKIENIENKLKKLEK